VYEDHYSLCFPITRYEIKPGDRHWVFNCRDGEITSHGSVISLGAHETEKSGFATLILSFFHYATLQASLRWRNKKSPAYLPDFSVVGMVRLPRMAR
jgi:hypothetical protein